MVITDKMLLLIVGYGLISFVILFIVGAIARFLTEKFYPMFILIAFWLILVLTLSLSVEGLIKPILTIITIFAFSLAMGIVQGPKPKKENKVN